MPEMTLNERAAIYAKQLENRTEMPGPLKYLADHAITDREIMSRYQIGCVVDPLPGDERFRGSLSIPYLTRRDIVSIKFRCCLPHDCHQHQGHQKYAQYAGQTPTIYNKAAFFLATDTIGVAEGEIDAIVATEFLGIPTVGLPGATQWAAHSRIWPLPFKDFDRVLIFADGDDAGKNSARAVSSDLGNRARIVRCDSGMDISKMIADGQVTDLKKRAGLYDEEEDMVSSEVRVEA